MYVNNDTTPTSAGSINANGYIAVELHNPYSVPLALHNWTLGIIARSGSATATMNVAPLTPGTTFPTTGNLAVPNGYGTTNKLFIGGGETGTAPPLPAVVIPQNGYIILENYQATPSGPDATYRPDDITVRGKFNVNVAVYVPNLHMAMGNELVLLRPHFAQQQAKVGYTFDTTSNLSAYKAVQPSLLDQSNLYNEGTVAAPFLQDFVPIDSYDFTNFPAPTNTNPTVWHYTQREVALERPTRGSASILVLILWRLRLVPDRTEPTRSHGQPLRLSLL